MAAQSPQEITQLLIAWSKGDEKALATLMPLIYQDLRRLASHYLRHENAGHTLQTTALVHEAYLRLACQKEVRWQNRVHFLAVAAQMMRRILVDHARARRFAKRGGGAQQVPIDEVMEMPDEQAAELVALDDALNALAKFDERESKIVE